jgi:hypothetical protein
VIARLALCAGAAVGTAVVVTVAVAVIDLWFVGQGRGSLLAPLIEHEALGIVLSLGDIAMLVLSGAGAVLAWRLSRRGG